MSEIKQCTHSEILWKTDKCNHPLLPGNYDQYRALCEDATLQTDKTQRH